MAELNETLDQKPVRYVAANEPANIAELVYLAQLSHVDQITIRKSLPLNKCTS